MSLGGYKCILFLLIQTTNSVVLISGDLNIMMCHQLVINVRVHCVVYSQCCCRFRDSLPSIPLRHFVLNEIYVV